MHLAAPHPEIPYRRAVAMANPSTRAAAEQQPAKTTSTRRSELIVFLIIVALIWPVVTVAVVGGYGFAVWMYQLVAGPPGPPGKS
jgi:periplasmic nitrate reductase NapE